LLVFVLRPYSESTLILLLQPLKLRASDELAHACYKMRLAQQLQAFSLKPPAASAKEQKEDHNQQDETEAATTVIANARTHVVAAAAEEKKEDHENEYERHERQSNTA
jgi:hypothetical protein